MGKLRASSGDESAAGGIAGTRFLALALQLGLVLTAAYLLNIEETHGLSRILVLVFAGFVVNAWAPMHYRPTIFLLTSLGAILIMLGPTNSLMLVGIGLVLVAICELPLHLGLRVALLAVAGATLAGLRLDWIRIPGADDLSSLVIPLLAAMFMFRLAVYVYDREHEREPAPLTRRLAYFFMLPNTCFPLFPVIDYRGFGRGYYGGDAATIYQRGARWIMRGIIHLVLYRIVYYHLTPTFGDIETLADVGQYVVSSYLLYLRVSGMFHIIIGILCLFGFNMPETHRLYFLSSSFTDFWRRINIYWKDFMMKVLYYPMFVRLKRLGQRTAIVVATLITLVASWLLHSYQIFWLRGTFPVLLQDALFWTILGIAVAINAVIEFNMGRVRRAGTREWRPRDAFVLSLKTVSMFFVMSLLWSFWTSSSIEEWIAVMRIGLDSSGGERLALLGLLAAAVGIGTMVQVLARRGWTLRTEEEPPFRRAAGTTCALAGFAVLMGIPQLHGPLPWEARTLLVSARAVRPNQRDLELQTRGYYEELLGAEVPSHAVWSVGGRRPDDWVTIGASPASRQTGDLRSYELVPDFDAQFKGARLTTNAFGMRDRGYDLQKPPETCRVALFGASYAMGAGIEESDLFVTRVEDRLNRERPLDACVRYEILNFAVGGYSAVQSAMLAREQAPRFQPDVLIYVSAHDDFEWGPSRLSQSIELGARLEGEAFFETLGERTGLTPEMSRFETLRRLRPFAPELVEWAFETMGSLADSLGARPVWVFVPARDRAENPDRGLFGRTSAVAREAGFEVISLEGVWDGQDVEALRLAPWDGHPNADGHALIADRLYEELAADWAVLTSPGARDEPSTATR